jgi:dolichol-phosphate mannosyltransferase
VVYTVRKDTSEVNFFKRTSSSWFYKVINRLANLHIQEGAADFRLLDRKVVEVINNEQESNLFLRGYIDWIGFKRIGIEYVPAKRFSGSSKYSMRKMLQFGMTGITQFSIKPLHLAFLLASIAFSLSTMYVLYAFWAALIAHVAVSGWLSIVVLVVFMQGIQFLLIGLVGEYVGRTFMQTKNRPEFIISEKSD